MTELARLIATWFYIGYTPKAPGTAGSLAAAAIAFLLGQIFGWTTADVAFLGALLFPLAIWAAGVVADDMKSKDPQIVVVDEVVGQWITFIGMTGRGFNWVGTLMGFALFRLFDMWKPWPIRRLEKLDGGVGIVVDDVMAGVYAALVLFAAGWFNLY
jgi:phosphatidylglycerophosphatase A